MKPNPRIQEEYRDAENYMNNQILNLKRRAGAEVPWPERPGTVWVHKHDGRTGHSSCANCGRDYNAHGAPEEEADKHGIPHNQRHMLCPFTQEAWYAYQRARQRATIDGCISMFLEDLRAFDAEEQADILTHVNAAFSAGETVPA